jgi:hypothetical protein
MTSGNRARAIAPTASPLSALGGVAAVTRLATLTAIIALTAGCSGVASAARTATARSASSAPGIPAPPAGVTAVQSTYTTCQSTTYHESAELMVEMGTSRHTTMTATSDADPNPANMSIHAVAHIAPNNMESIITDGVGYTRNNSSKWFKQPITPTPPGEGHLPCEEFYAFRELTADAITETDSPTAAADPNTPHHYRIHTSAWRLLATAPLFMPAFLNQLSHNDRAVDATLTLDPAGHPTAYQVEVQFQGAGSEQMKSAFHETLSAFGAPVPIRTPDPSQVTDQIPSGLTSVPSMESPGG